eukprot:Seg3535.2 transcript_id=Seg3535.2/GoldUCD/mRNA.D3Y31 product="Secretory carrier-associated membrane protein 2" protein_id=Seg3535.2/GoldUCD/D3Y31
MADQDVNPFADPNDVNPFADSSVTSATGGATKDLDDYNPFAEQASRNQPTLAVTGGATTAASTQPATIEPTRAAEPPPSYTPYPSANQQSDQDAMKKRQEELEKKAAELSRREQELKTLQQQVTRENNFPPLPKKFCPKPCFFHDISIDIPIEYQKTCRMLFYLWQLYSFALFFNFICSLALLASGGANGAETFGVSLLYFVLFIPCSFLFWYRPIYQAFKNDSSFNFMLFFVVFFFQIVLTIVYALGIPSFGTCGWINAGKAFDAKNKAVAAMMFISGAFFTVLVIFKIILLKRVHSIYRTTGASLHKAQGELARGVISNKNVQAAAAEAARSSVQAQATRY